MEQSKCVKPWRNRVMDGRLKKTIKGIKKTTGILKKITRFVFAPVIFLWDQSRIATVAVIGVVVGMPEATWSVLTMVGRVVKSIALAVPPLAFSLVKSFGTACLSASSFYYQQIFGGNEQIPKSNESTNQIAIVREERLDYSSGGIIRQTNHSERQSVLAQSISEELSDKSACMMPQSVVSKTDSRISGAYESNLNLMPAFPKMPRSMAGVIHKMVYSAAEKSGDFSRIGNGLIIIQDKINSNNFISCHIGFRPLENLDSGAYNVIFGYQKPLSGKTVLGRSLSGTCFNIKMGDVAIGINLVDDAGKSKLVLSKCRDDLPVYSMVRRDGILLVTVDEKMNTIPVRQAEYVASALAMSVDKNMRDSAIRKDLIIHQTRAKDVFAERKKRLSSQKKVEINSGYRYYNER